MIYELRWVHEEAPMFEPFKYTDPNASDEVKADEMERSYRSNVACQILTGYYQSLAAEPPPWYPPEEQLEDWTIKRRMSELEARPDIRYEIMCNGFATGMPEKTTRNMTPSDQAHLLDQTRVSGDKTAEQHVRIFDYQALMCHTDLVLRYLQITKRIDWHDHNRSTRNFLLEVLAGGLSGHRTYKIDDDGIRQTYLPIILHHELLAELDLIEYLKIVGLERQIEILKRRAAAEANNQFFSVKQELTEIVTVIELCDMMPVHYFKPVFELIGRKLGFIQPPVEVTEPETKDGDDASQIVVGELPDVSPGSLPVVLQVAGVVGASGDEGPKA